MNRPVGSRTRGGSHSGQSRPGLRAALVNEATELRGVVLSSGGFSLIELLIVVAIIGTLSAIAVPAFLEALMKAKITACITDIRSIEAMVMTYASDDGELPDRLSEVGAGSLVDPWGSPYRYLRIDGGSAPPGKRRKDHFMVPVNSDFDLYSMGPDRDSKPPFTAKASRDDIVRTSDGGYVGPVSGY